MDPTDIQSILDNSGVIPRPGSGLLPAKSLAGNNVQHISMHDIPDGEFDDIDLIPIVGQPQQQLRRFPQANIGDSISIPGRSDYMDPNTGLPGNPGTNEARDEITVVSFAQSIFPDTDEWIDEHSVRFTEWISNSMVDFANTVAGLQGAQDVSQFLKTGFEGLLRLIKENIAMNNEIQYGDSSLREDNTVRSRRPVPPVATYDKNGLATMELIMKFKDIMLSHGVGNESALAAYRYITGTNNVYDYSVMKWLTLPMNLTNIYYSNPLKAAVEVALHDLRTRFNYPEDGPLFSRILASPMRTSFAELVSAILDIRKLKNRVHSTPDQRAEAEEAKARYVDEFRDWIQSGAPIPQTQAKQTKQPALLPGLAKGVPKKNVPGAQQQGKQGQFIKTSFTQNIPGISSRATAGGIELYGDGIESSLYDTPNIPKLTHF